jgi:E3 ubiquitin-protein ligase TRIP12
VNRVFTERVIAQLANPFETLTGRSLFLSIIIRFPFLFSLEDRAFAFKLAAFDVVTATGLLFKRFGIKESLYGIIMPPLRCDVDPSALWHDGFRLMNTIAQSIVPIRVSFNNDPGIGPGPTKEFFTRFSREFARQSRDIFRSESRNGLYCVDSLGLFPSPAARSQYFFALGILCAKAILMDYTLDLAFNPAFFKLLRDEIVPMRLVAPAIDDALSRMTPGNWDDFSYPGNDRLVMAPAMDQSVHTYCALAREYTCGSKHFADVTKEFLSGFNSLLPFTAFNALTPVEFGALISGHEAPFTEEAIRAHIDFIGFRNGSRAMEFFVHAVPRLSADEQKDLLQFITGSRRPPLGGLKEFHPKITVSRKDCSSIGFEALPTAMTCSNLLNLPDYETEAKFVEKIKLAARDGCEGFDHS